MIVVCANRTTEETKSRKSETEKELLRKENDSRKLSAIERASERARKRD